jgi:hypothetical protein
LLVLTLARNQVTYPAAGTLNVSFATGNQMNMAMKNGLTGILAIIDANIETGDRGIVGQDLSPHKLKEPVTGIYF